MTLYYHEIKSSNIKLHGDASTRAATCHQPWSDVSKTPEYVLLRQIKLSSFFSPFCSCWGWCAARPRLLVPLEQHNCGAAPQQLVVVEQLSYKSEPVIMMRFISNTMQAVVVKIKRTAEHLCHPREAVWVCADQTLSELQHNLFFLLLFSYWILNMNISHILSTFSPLINIKELMQWMHVIFSLQSCFSPYETQQTRTHSKRLI